MTGGGPTISRTVRVWALLSVSYSTREGGAVAASGSGKRSDRNPAFLRADAPLSTLLLYERGDHRLFAKCGVCCEFRGLTRESINADKGPAILRNVHLQKEEPLSVIQGSTLVGMPGSVVGAQELVDGEYRSVDLEPR